MLNQMESTLREYTTPRESEIWGFCRLGNTCHIYDYDVNNGRFTEIFLTVTPTSLYRS